MRLNAFLSDNALPKSILSKFPNSMKESREAHNFSWFSDFSRIFQNNLIVRLCSADDFTSEIMPWICFYEDTKTQKLNKIARCEETPMREVFPNFPAFHEIFGIFWHWNRIQQMISHRKWFFEYGFSSKWSFNSKKCRALWSDRDFAKYFLWGRALKTSEPGPLFGESTMIVVIYTLENVIHNGFHPCL